MATPLSKVKVQTIDEQIAEATARKEAELAQEIQQIKLAAEVDDARFELKQKIRGEYKTLEKKHDDEDKELSKTIETYKADFKEKYGVPFEIEPKPFVIPYSREQKLNKKAELASKELVNGKPKYRLSDDKKSLIGAKGDAITSVVSVYVDGKKETISARNIFKYLKPEATPAELDELFPPKDTRAKEFRTPSNIKTDLGGDLGKL